MFTENPLDPLDFTVFQPYQEKSPLQLTIS